MHSSTRISSPCAKAAAMAAGSSSGGVDFRDAERRAVGVGFHEEGQPQVGDDPRRIERLVPAEEHLAGEVDAASRERALGGDLVEGDDRRDHRARRIGNAHHVEVALQPAVLAGRAVDDDERVVELPPLAFHGEREVVLVHLPLPPVRRRVVPVAAMQVDYRDVVFPAVQRRGDLCGALQGDLPFGRVAAREECYFQFFHRCPCRLYRFYCFAVRLGRLRGCRGPCSGTPESPAPSRRTAGPRRCPCRGPAPG